MKRLAFVVCFLAMFGSFALGAESTSNPNGAKSKSPMTLEQRQKMAGFHEKMAICLRSDRAMQECREEMMNGCKETMGKSGCPMMQEKMDPKMHHSMMNDDEAAK